MIKNKFNNLIMGFLLGSAILNIGGCNFESQKSIKSTINPTNESKKSTINPTQYNCDYWNKSIGTGSPDKQKNILVSGSELGESGLGDLYEEKWDECFIFFDNSKGILVIEASISWRSSEMNIINMKRKVFELDINQEKYTEKIIDNIGGKEIFNALSPGFNQELATYKIENNSVANKTIIYLEETGNSLKKEESAWAKFDWRERIELDTLVYEKLFSGKLITVNPELTKQSKGMSESEESEESEEIKNPSWREIPGTKLEGDQNDQYDIPAFINVNGIIKNGNILTYDLVNPDSGYTQVQTNCKTRKFRAVRKGDFQSDTRVNYIKQVDPWQKPSSPYHEALIKFVCNL